MHEKDHSRVHYVYVVIRKLDTKILGQIILHNGVVDQSISTCITTILCAKELWSGHKLSYNRLKTFGCEAYSHVPKELCAKLAPKARRCIIIGYGQDGQFGYCLWDLES